MKHPQEDIHRIREYIQNNLLDRWNTKSALELKFQESVKFLNKELDHSYLIRIQDVYSILQIEVPLDYHKWRLEPKNKVESPLLFKGKINYRDFKTVGENKYLFELNRLHVIPALAYYCTLNQDLNKASDIKVYSIIELLINSWIEENQFQKSANWKSGIEVGIRGFNLLITRILLNSVPESQNLRKKIDVMLTYHYQFLKTHLSLYSSANNHLLKELFGLICISCVYSFASRKKDLKYYFDYYQRELLKQTFEDGGSKEQSVHYHAAVLNASFLILHFTGKIGIVPRTDFLARLKSMCVYLDDMSVGGKIESLFGDKDDSNILFDIFDKNFNLYHSLLLTGKRLFPDIHYSCFKSQDARLDFINLLFYEDLSWKTPANCVLQNENYTYYNTSGYFIFKNKNLNSRLYFDVGEMGFGPLAAHGHSDLLHFTLWIDDQPFIVDPGAYQYNAKYLKWRNFFKGITAHNTISVNNQNHSKSLGTMMWSKLPKIDVLEFNSSLESTFCEAQHSAFYNDSGPIKHKRKIYSKGNTYYIEDALSGKGNFKTDFYLHFHPTVSVKIDNSIIILEKKRVKVEIHNKLFLNAKLYMGDSDLPLGWYSSSYDVKVPTTSLKADVDVNDCHTVSTFIKIIRQ